MLNNFLFWALIIATVALALISIQLLRTSRRVKRQSQEIQLSEQKYRLLFENASEGVAVLIGQKVVLANPKALEISGYSRDEISGIDFDQMIHPDDLEEVRERYSIRTTGEENLRQTPFRILSRRGNVTWVLVRAEPIEWEGKPAMLAILTDITSQKLVDETISRERNLLRILIDNLPDYIYIKDTGGHFTLVNKSAARILGSEDPETITGKTEFDFLPEALASRINVNENAMLRSGASSLTYEEIFTGPDGEARWVLMTVVALRKNRREISGLVGIGRDVTDYKRTISALNLSETKFSKAFHTSPDALCILRFPQGNYLEVNQGFVNMSGYSPQEVLGKVPAEQGLWNSLEDSKRIGDILEEKGEVSDLEIHFHRKDGSLVIGSVSARVLEINNETCALAIIHDITEKYRAEEALRESEARYRLLFQRSPVGIFHFDRELNITDTNERFAEIMHTQREELLAIKLVFTEGNEAEKALRDVFNSTESSYEGPYLLEDGTRLKIFLRTAPAYNEVHEVVGGIGIVEDVTERIQAAEALLRNQERFRRYFELGLIGIAITNTARLYTQFNDRLCEILGYTRIELAQMSWVENTHPDDQAREIRLFEQMAAGGIDHYELDKRLIRKDGQVVYVNLSVGCVRREDGQVEDVISFIQDITERKQIEDQSQRQLKFLAALRVVDMAMITSIDMDKTLRVIIDQVMLQLNVDAASILLYDPADECLRFAAGQGFYTSIIHDVHLKIGEGYAGRAALQRKRVFIANLMDRADPQVDRKLMPSEEFVVYFGVPLIAKGEIKGVLELFHRSYLNPRPDWTRFLEAIADQAAIAIDNATLYNDSQRANTELTHAYDATIAGWSHALELRDHETQGHSQRLSEMTIRLAVMLGVAEHNLIHLRRGVLLHDVGKMGIPDSILLKAGPLTPEEWAIMRKHPEYAYQLLSNIPFLLPAMDIPYCHHERWDGAGYPRGLKGEDIPIVARIFSMVDIWDSLCSVRPYKPAWSAEKANEYIQEQSGTRFDPRVVRAFLDMRSHPNQGPLQNKPEDQQRP
jgi:PAS domain S-box-containing protein